MSRREQTDGWPVDQRWSWTIDLGLLERERVLRGWTRSELAHRARVDPGTISTMFRRRRRPVLGTVKAVTLTLDLNLGDVLRFREVEDGAADHWWDRE